LGELLQIVELVLAPEKLVAELYDMEVYPPTPTLNRTENGMVSEPPLLVTTKLPEPVKKLTPKSEV
jgi:hypothetical protein